MLTAPRFENLLDLFQETLHQGTWHFFIFKAIYILEVRTLSFNAWHCDCRALPALTFVFSLQTLSQEKVAYFLVEVQEVF